MKECTARYDIFAWHRWPMISRRRSLQSISKYTDFQAEPPKFNFTAVGVRYALYYVRNDVFMEHGTQAAVAASLHAEKVKFIDGNNLNHGETTLASDVRCYTVNDFMSEFNRLEAARNEARKNYRDEAARFAEELPFGDGCLDVADD